MSAVADSAQPGNVESPRRGWGPAVSSTTTLILVRHGVTAMTVDKRFSGGLGGGNPPLSDLGREQAHEAGAWLRSLTEHVDAVITSPVLRTVQTAEIIAAELGQDPIEEPAFGEMEFGEWDGLSFAEVAERFPDEMKAWFASLDAAPHGGESFRQVEGRVMAGLAGVLDAHEGRTLVLVSHVTPIKVLVSRALGAPLDSVYRMELTPASVSAVSYYPDTRPSADPDATGADRFVSSLRLFNARPGDTPFTP